MGRLTCAETRTTCRDVGILRSSLFALIVSLLLATGYGFDLFADCCTHSQTHSQQQKGPGASSDKAPVQDDSCQCICHQTVAPGVGLQPVTATVTLVPSTLPAFADEIPPDAVPLGIDYPPQLA